jgi:2-hydroxychromene-2-carboxylate isomerase
MSKTIDFYWDLGSTNSYFAIRLIKPIAERHGAVINWHPFNVGYFFKANNYVLMDESKAKLRNRRDDLMRWAKKYDFPFHIPRAFPIKTSRALRGAIAMRNWDREEQFIDAIFAAYWERGDGQIGAYASLRPIAESLGVDPDAFEAHAESEEVRQALIDSTNRAIERDVFGVPSMIIGNDLYWGKDRMDFIEEHLARLGS